LSSALTVVSFAISAFNASLSVGCPSKAAAASSKSFFAFLYLFVSIEMLELEISSCLVF